MKTITFYTQFFRFVIIKDKICMIHWVFRPIYPHTQLKWCLLLAWYYDPKAYWYSVFSVRYKDYIGILWQMQLRGLTLSVYIIISSFHRVIGITCMKKSPFPMKFYLFQLPAITPSSSPTQTPITPNLHITLQRTRDLLALWKCCLALILLCTP